MAWNSNRGAASIQRPGAGSVAAPASNGATPVVEAPPASAGAAADGVAELEELAGHNPSDIGAHLALAGVYARMGNADAALHVYRRIVKRRGLSPFLVQVIFEDLNYLETDNRDNPRVHLVRGDLLIGEGRYREAMEEYNRMSQLAGRR